MRGLPVSSLTTLQDGNKQAMRAVQRRLASVVVAAGLVAASRGEDPTAIAVGAPAAPLPVAGPAGARSAPQAPVDATLQLAAVCDPGAGEPSAIAVELTLPLTGRPVFRLDDDVY